MCPDRPLSSSFLFLFVVYFSQYLFLLYIIFMSDKKAWNFPVSLFGLQVLLVRVLLDRAELCVPDPSLLAGRHWSLRQEISTLRLTSSDSYLFKVETFLSVLNYCLSHTGVLCRSCWQQDPRPGTDWVSRVAAHPYCLSGSSKTHKKDVPTRTTLLSRSQYDLAPERAYFSNFPNYMK